MADFWTLDWKQIYGMVARPLVLDGHNLLNHGALKSLGFEYVSFDRPDLAAEIAVV